MDISAVEPLLLKYNIPAELISRLKESAAALPPDLIDDGWAAAPHIPGLSAFESELLAVYMLEDIAPELGVAVEDADRWDMAGLPDKQQLLRKAELPIDIDSNARAEETFRPHASGLATSVASAMDDSSKNRDRRHEGA